MPANEGSAPVIPLGPAGCKDCVDKDFLVANGNTREELTIATTHEVALGIASILGKPGTRNPFLTSFRGQSLDSAAEIINAIISECSDAGIGIANIELDPDLRRHMIAARGYCESVRLESCEDLIGDMRLFAK